MDDRRPRRPALLGKTALDSLGGSPDPAELAETAHATASLLVESGRATDDEAARARLVGLVDDVGLDTIADMWAQRPARSLPGALWRLYALREWVRTDAVEASEDFTAGRSVADVPHVVAGAADPPTPEALRLLLDEVLHGVFGGDLDVALERAGAFCRVVVAGRVHRADDLEHEDGAAAVALTRSAASLRDCAEDLEAAAALWRSHDLV
ncbi:MAG: hypothetical protein ACRDWY_01395 [Actinomycetes bacterium]